MYYQIEIRRSEPGYSTCLAFGDYDGDLAIGLGGSHVTVSDSLLGVFYVAEGEVARRFRDCKTLDDAVELWRAVITAELREEPQLLYDIVSNAVNSGSREGAAEKQEEILRVLGVQR